MGQVAYSCDVQPRSMENIKHSNHNPNPTRPLRTVCASANRAATVWHKYGKSPKCTKRYASANRAATNTNKFTIPLYLLIFVLGLILSVTTQVGKWFMSTWVKISNSFRFCCLKMPIIRVGLKFFFNFHPKLPVRRPFCYLKIFKFWDTIKNLTQKCPPSLQ